MKKIPSSRNQLWSVVMRMLSQLWDPNKSPLTKYGQDILLQPNPLRYQRMKIQMKPQRNQSHWIVHTHITLSILRRWSGRCTTTTVNLKHGLITSVWGATKHYRRYCIWIPAPPLQVWTPLFQATQTHGKVGHHPQEIRKVWHPNMCGMHVCQVYSQTMAWELQKDTTQSSTSRQPWADSLSGPASITNSRAIGIDDCNPHYQKI